MNETESARRQDPAPEVTEEEDALEAAEAALAADARAGAEAGMTAREAELSAEAAALRDQLLRTLADLDNVRKRGERDKEQTRKFGIANFAKDLLSAADNLRRALDHVPEDQTGLDQGDRNLIVGVEMTEREVLAAFEKNGVRRIDPMGEKFDYNFHQAMFELENTGKEPGTVVQVLQPGYAIEERVLRPAMVGVAKGSPAGTPPHLDTTV